MGPEAAPCDHSLAAAGWKAVTNTQRREPLVISATIDRKQSEMRLHLPRTATLTGCLCNFPRRDSIHGVKARCHKEWSGPGIRKDKKGTAIVDGFASGPVIAL
jgi:hypothetical protein